MTGFSTVEKPSFPLPRPGETSYAILEAIHESWQGSSYGPTVEELRQKVELSSRSGVQFHISRLLDAGLLDNIPNRRRTLRLTDRGRRLLRVFADLDAS